VWFRAGGEETHAEASVHVPRERQRHRRHRHPRVVPRRRDRGPHDGLGVPARAGRPTRRPEGQPLLGRPRLRLAPRHLALHSGRHGSLGGGFAARETLASGRTAGRSPGDELASCQSQSDPLSRRARRGRPSLTLLVPVRGSSSTANHRVGIL
jgi:hypothetical protein